MAALKLILKNNISELDHLARFLEETGDQMGFSMKLVMNLNLVLEELVTNIIFYGFKDKAPHEITIDFNIDDDKVAITITDDGIPFNPTQKDTPDSIDKSIDERDIGGLGIHFVNSLMNSMNYERKDNKNILYLIKTRD